MKSSINVIKEDIYYGTEKETGLDIVMYRAYHKLINGEAGQGMWTVCVRDTGKVLKSSPFRNDLIEKFFK